MLKLSIIQQSNQVISLDSISQATVLDIYKSKYRATICS